MSPKKVQPTRSGPITPLNPELALKEFTALLEKAARLRRDSPEFSAWHADVMIALSRFYGRDSEEYSRFDGIRFSLFFSSSETPESDFEEAFQHGLAQARLFLESRKKDWEGQIPSKVVRRAVVANPKDVFVVHGHDHGMKETIARFLSKTGLNPIILHEQPDEGRTIIEKLEKHADVSFAVAIFSRDDLGVAKEDISEPNIRRELSSCRRRLEVILVDFQ